jgi:hypothetical protein
MRKLWTQPLTWATPTSTLEAASVISSVRGKVDSSTVLSRAGVDAPLGFVLSFFHTFVLVDLQSHLRSVKKTQTCASCGFVDVYENVYADHLHISDRITEGVFGLFPRALLLVSRWIR